VGKAYERERGMKGQPLSAKDRRAGRKVMSYLHRVSRLIAQVRCILQGLIRPSTPNLTCEQVIGFIADYLTGALDPETTAAFEVHLRGCDDCVAFLNTYQRTIAAVQSLRFDDIPAEMEARVRRFLET
jgi:hypothetical protein